MSHVIKAGLWTEKIRVSKGELDLDQLIEQVAGGGSSYTFSNGLTNTAGVVGLGGSLAQYTSIDSTQGFELMTSDKYFYIDNDVMLLQDAINGGGIRIENGTLRLSGGNVSIQRSFIFLGGYVSFPDAFTIATVTPNPLNQILPRITIDELGNISFPNTNEYTISSENGLFDIQITGVNNEQTEVTLTPSLINIHAANAGTDSYDIYLNDPINSPDGIAISTNNNTRILVDKDGNISMSNTNNFLLTTGLDKTVDFELGDFNGGGRGVSFIMESADSDQSYAALYASENGSQYAGIGVDASGNVICESKAGIFQVRTGTLIAGGVTNRFSINVDGNISMPTLPTSSAGLTSGMLWRDAGAANVIKMVP